MRVLISLLLISLVFTTGCVMPAPPEEEAPLEPEEGVDDATLNDLESDLGELDSLINSTEFDELEDSGITENIFEEG